MAQKLNSIKYRQHHEKNSFTKNKNNIKENGGSTIKTIRFVGKNYIFYTPNGHGKISTLPLIFVVATKQE